jgi:hypothetical protein
MTLIGVEATGKDRPMKSTKSIATSTFLFGLIGLLEGCMVGPREGSKGQIDHPAAQSGKIGRSICLYDRHQEKADTQTSIPG